MDESISKNDDDPSRRNRKIDPTAALAQFEAILGTSPKGRDIFTQCQKLRVWAETNACYFTVGDEVTKSRIGGLEHLIWFDETTQQVVKITYGGCFGRSVRRIETGLVPASPLEYFARWRLHNSLFGTITFIRGVTTLPDNSLAISVTQRVLPGDLPSSAQIDSFLTKIGFGKLSSHPFAWYRESDSTALFDARPANFVFG